MSPPLRKTLHGLAIPGALALCLAAIYATGDAILAPAPISTSPGFLETILASRAVVSAVRIAVIAAAAFVVVSIVALISRRQWPTRIGPVHLSEDVSSLKAENQRLQTGIEFYRAIMEARDDFATNPNTRRRPSST
jgi:hypothetical protein